MLLNKIEGIGYQRNKTAKEGYVKQLGWRRETFVWELHRWYGFDPIIDMPPDFMHLSMGLIKDYLHIQASLLKLVEEGCQGIDFPDLKHFFHIGMRV